MTLAHTRQAAAASAGFRTARAQFRQRAAAAWLARRSKTAQAKTAGIPIRPGERVLTLDHGPASSLVAATTAAVYLGGQGQPGRQWCRLGWKMWSGSAGMTGVACWPSPAPGPAGCGGKNWRWTATAHWWS